MANVIHIFLRLMKTANELLYMHFKCDLKKIRVYTICIDVL
jgi:hypothetical protein